MIIYKITNVITGSIYVGMTTQKLSVRWSGHVANAKRDKTALARAIAKYGREAFRVEQIAAASSLEEMQSLERQFIADLKSTTKHGGYNIALGGLGAFGVPRSPEWRAKLRAANLGKKHSPESRAKMSAMRRATGKSAIQLAAWEEIRSRADVKAKVDAARKGRRCPEDARVKMSLAQRGRAPWRGIAAAAAAQKSRMATVCGPDHAKGGNLYICRGRACCLACSRRSAAKYRARKKAALSAKVAA